MPLSTEQQKVINSLISNTLINDYAEIHEELCDHFIIGVETQMQTGTPFTDALTAVHAEFGGDQGLLTIEHNHIKEIKKVGKVLYKKFAIGYFTSFRWLISVLAAGVIISVNLFYGNLYLGPINMMLILTANFYALWYFRNWRLEGELDSPYSQRKSLRAITIHRFYIPIMLIMLLPMNFSIAMHDFPRNSNTTVWQSVMTIAVCLGIDFSLSFIRFAKTSWLVPPVAARS